MLEASSPAAGYSVAAQLADAGGPIQRGRLDWHPFPHGPRGWAGTVARPGAQHLAVAGGWAACLPGAMGTGAQHCLPPPAAGWRRAGEASRSLPAGPAPAAGAGRHRTRPLLARLHGAEPLWRRASGARPGERGPVLASGH